MTIPAGDENKGLSANLCLYAHIRIHSAHSAVARKLMLSVNALPIKKTGTSSELLFDHKSV